MDDVFISYSRRDEQFVRRLHEALCEGGRNVWVHREDIRSGAAAWGADLHPGIAAANSFAYVISPDSIASPHCAKEIEMAVAENKRLVPVVRHEVPPADVPEPMRKPNWIFFRDGDDFHESLEKLVYALDTALEWVRAKERVLDDVFISYSRHDLEFVRGLHEALAKDGRNVWVDFEDIPPAADWEAELHPGIAAAGAFVYVISPHSIASPHCAKEVEMAVAEHKRLVPVVRQEVPRADVPEPIWACNWLFFRDGDDFDDSLENLVYALEIDSDWVRTHTRLLVRANEWKQRGKGRRRLLRGRDLAEAEAEAAFASETEKHPHPTQLQTEYVHASRNAAERRRQVTIGALTFALVVAIALVVVALAEGRQAIAGPAPSLTRAKHHAKTCPQWPSGGSAPRRST